ncbi:hypothetical protein J1614_004316, partial [Plenodomus biglobosus]
MPARLEELRIIQWANTKAVPRNIFIYNGRLLLVFSYNKASTRSNNAFYIIRLPCPGTNHHLFRRYSDTDGYYTQPQALQAFQRSTTKCPLTLNFTLYRQIAVSIAKKHLPGLVQAFNSHIPNDSSGFLQLLSIQTGHKPSTHASDYGLDRAVPAKLQPKLIERYVQNSQLWHQFTKTTKDKAPTQGHKGSELQQEAATSRLPSPNSAAPKVITSDQLDLNQPDPASQ